MTGKRLKKLFMSRGISRNGADILLGFKGTIYIGNAEVPLPNEIKLKLIAPEKRRKKK